MIYSEMALKVLYGLSQHFQARPGQGSEEGQSTVGMYYYVFQQGMQVKPRIYCQPAQVNLAASLVKPASHDGGTRETWFAG